MTVQKLRDILFKYNQESEVYIRSLEELEENELTNIFSIEEEIGDPDKIDIVINLSNQ